MTYREIVYYCLDSIKSSNGDSDVTEEHVIFLANNYRLFLLEEKKKKEGEDSFSSANLQTICIDLELADAIPGLDYCNDLYLRSVLEIPQMLNLSSANVNIYDLFNIMTALVSRERFKFVGNNKYMTNIIYCTIGPDDHLYFKSVNPQFKYLKTAKITGVFENAEEAAKLSCDGESDAKCDILDLEFPLQTDLVPQMLLLIIKELLGVNYRPEDSINNSIDDLADIASFVRRLMKSDFAKLMTL